MAADPPLLSILLPTHNRADVLPFAIRSVLAQTVADFELLIVGDGCTDDTAEVVAAFLAVDPRICWFDLPKAPSFGYANRNVALRAARGEMIGFVAHDDIISTDHFELLLAELENPGVHLVHGGSAWIGSEGNIVPTVFHLNDAAMLGEFLAKRWNRVPATAFVHRRAVFDRVGYWNETLPSGADMDFWGRIIQAHGVNSLRVVDTVTTFHFRAVWRTQDQQAPDNEPLWKILHHQPGRLDPALKIAIQPGETEQLAFWTTITEHKDAVLSIRHALSLALQSFAWDLELRVGAQRIDSGAVDSLTTLHAKLKQQRNQTKRLRKKLDEALAELAACKSTRSTPRKPFWRRLWSKG